MIFIKCFKKSILLSGPNRTAEHWSYLIIYVYGSFETFFRKKIIDLNIFFILGFHLGYCSLFQCYGHICRAPILRSVFTLWKQIANSGSKFQRIFNFGTSLGRLRLFVALHKGRRISELCFQFSPSPKPWTKVLTKGQLVLKCPFGLFKSSKKTAKCVPGFLP